MISKNMLAFWKPWCTSNIFTFEFECSLKTLIYFSMIPPLLLLGMITTMSGSSTLANWRELWTLLCLQNCCKKCTFNVYSNSYSPFLFVLVSETAVSICQAQPTYWGKKNKNKNVWGQEKLHLFLLHFVTFVCLLRGKLISQFSAEEKASWAELQPMKPFQVLQLCWIAFQLHANVKSCCLRNQFLGRVLLIYWRNTWRKTCLLRLCRDVQLSASSSESSPYFLVGVIWGIIQCI